MLKLALAERFFPLSGGSGSRVTFIIFTTSPDFPAVCQNKQKNNKNKKQQQKTNKQKFAVSLAGWLYSNLELVPYHSWTRCLPLSCHRARVDEIQSLSRQRGAGPGGKQLTAQKRCRPARTHTQATSTSWFQQASPRGEAVGFCTAGVGEPDRKIER